MADRSSGKNSIERKLVSLLVAGNALVVLAVSLCFVIFALASGSGEIRSIAAFPASLVIGSLLAAILLARLFSGRVKLLIFDPISQLIQKMEIVSRSQDYHVRVQSASDDELGLLFGCFNEMLAEIAVRDERLALHSEELKLEVEERTRELSQVNRRLEESLEKVSRAMETAQAANRAKSEFLAQMSHEIRTPMYGVLGMTELLQGTDLSREQARFVDTVRRSGEALLSIINNILDFSKIEAGRMELEVIPFDLHELLTDARQMFSEEAHRKGLELTCEIAEDLPRHVMGDPGRLRQVLVNLIGNAIKFTPHGWVRLSAVLERPPGLVRFSICDSGIGIPPDAQARIFEQFSQVDESVTRKYGGTGLGLAIARQLAELMGGELFVASEPGKGATFSFTVRLEAGGSREWVRPERSCTALRNKRVLLVAARNATREALLSQLNGWGMDVEQVSDATGALCRVASAPFDLALIDQRVAGTEGVELAAAIRSVPAGFSVRLVLLSDEESLTEVGLARESDGICFIKKSLRQYGLYAALVRALGMEQSPADPDGSDPLLHSPHVLLVEDNPVNQEVGRGLLESLGCSVELAENGLIAIEAVQKNCYDVVFMDCQMPELDGLEATRRIRQWEQDAEPNAAAARRRHLPIIALTANAMKGDRVACLSSGADDYLSKPFTRDELSAMLSQHLQAAREGGDRASVNPAAPLALAITPEEGGKGAIEMIRALPGSRGIEILRKVVDLYLSSTPMLLQTMREAESGKDPEKLKAAAHSFKSSSANLGAVRLAGVCKELETLGRRGSTEGALPLLLQVEEEYRMVRDALQGGQLC